MNRNTLEEIDQVLENQTKHLHAANNLKHEIEQQRIKVLDKQMEVMISTNFKDEGIGTKEERASFCEVQTMEDLIKLSDLRRQHRTAKIEADMLEKRYEALLIKFNKE